MTTKTITLKPSRPHEAQAEMLSSPALYKVADCGRRLGKTEMFIEMLGIGHGGMNGHVKLHQAALDGFPVAYWSLTYKNVDEMWGRLKAVYAPLITYKNETLKQIDLISGGSIECWSTEKINSARGRAYKGVIVDEAGWTPNLMAIWNDAIQAMLLDFEGWAVFGGTPNGMNDYFTMYQWGQDENRPLWGSWKFPSMANPYLSKTYLEQIKQNVPERTWKQEYLAEFLEDGGAVFRNILSCIDDYLMTDDMDKPSDNIVMGADLGRHNDYTVIIVMDANTHKVVGIDRFTDISWDIQGMRIEALAQKWNPHTIVMEENFNDSFVEQLQMKGLDIKPFRTTASSKQKVINQLALAFEQNDIAIPNDPVLISELQAFSIEQLPSGNYRYRAPSGMHDDMVMALALAWDGVRDSSIVIDFA